MKLVFLSNVPADYKQGTDYVAIVTDDLFQMGKQAADVLAESLDSKGKVGWIFHDATYYVTNQRDNAFKTTIENDYPDMEIVAEAGIADPARAEEIASAMLLKNPDLDGIYVTWAEPADGVLAALRASGNTHTKVVTLDLSEPVALDMVKGGNVAGIVADEAYELGRAMAATGHEGASRRGEPAVHRRARADRDEGERRRGLAEVAPPRRAAVRSRCRTVGGHHAIHLSRSPLCSARCAGLRRRGHHHRARTARPRRPPPTWC